MKRLLTISAICVALAGCASANAPVNGWVYSNVSGPVALGDAQDKPTKVGRATTRTILGLYAVGDASIEAAAKAGGITKIHHVDEEAQVILGIIADYTTVVYGN